MKVLRFFLAVFALFAMLPDYSGAASPVTVSGIRYSSGKPATEIVITLTERPGYSVNQALAPLSLQIELNGAILSPLLPQFLPINDGRVKGVESFQYSKDSAKVTIGLERGAAYKVSFKDTVGFVILIEITDKDPAGTDLPGKLAP